MWLNWDTLAWIEIGICWFSWIGSINELILCWSNLPHFLNLIFLSDVQIHFAKCQFMRGESQLSENIQTTKLNSVDKIQKWIEFKELTDDAKFFQSWFPSWNLKWTLVSSENKKRYLMFRDLGDSIGLSCSERSIDNWHKLHSWIVVKSLQRNINFMLSHSPYKDKRYLRYLRYLMFEIRVIQLVWVALREVLITDTSCTAG